MNEQIVYLPLDKIEVASQVRTEFDLESLRGLADTMAALGQLGQSVFAAKATFTS